MLVFISSFRSIVRKLGLVNTSEIFAVSKPKFALHRPVCRFTYTMSRPKKVILDCDPGTDDAQALMMLLAKTQRQKIDVLGVTTVFGNTELKHTKVNALRTLQVCGRLDIPVFGGADRGLTGRPPVNDAFHGEDGFGDVPDPNAPSVDLVKKQHASCFLAEVAEKFAGEITLIATGPLTNLAVALRLDQQLGSKFKELIIMGGNTQGRGNITAAAEFNFYSDPEGAKVVLEEWKGLITWVTKDICDESAFDWEWYDDLIAFDTPKAKFIELIDKTLAEHRYESPKYFMWDQLAVAIAIDPAVVMETKDVYTTVETSGGLTLGQSVTDWEKKMKKEPNVRIVTKINLELYGQLVKDAIL